jgi:pilus assembly protein CpaD
MALMVADKEHLVHGARSTGDTMVMSSSKAIQTYRDAKPTGNGGITVKATSSQSSGGN